MSLLHKAFSGLVLLQSAMAFSQGKINIHGAKMNVVSGAYVTTADVSLTSPSSLNIDSSTLVVGRNINSVSNINLRNGTLETTSGAAQTIPANSFVNNAVDNFIVANTSSSGVTLGGPVDIYTSLTYITNGTKLTTNDALTIKSTATKTAYVGDLTGNDVVGKVTVERYIPSRKAWRLLSIPTNTAQTTKDAWQEGATNMSSNPVPGYGIQITSNRATWAADGFDVYSSGGPSMKYYDPATNAFLGVTGTNIGINTKSGYFTFIRGDRTASAYTSPVTETVVRSQGPLYMQDQAPISVAASKFAVIGNPYASAVDMRFISKTGLKDFFYVWDPKIGGAYGYGAYQTFSNNGNDDYVVTPGGGSYGPAGSIYNYIESGLAFLVQATSSGGSLTFKEVAKSTNSGTIGRQASGVKQSLLRTSLYGVNSDNSSYIADGLMVNYDDSYSNDVDDLDAIKSTNTGENLSVKNGKTLLVIERRHTIVKDDTIFLNLGSVKAQRYRFEVAASRLSQPGLSGFLEDHYLNTKTPLNLEGNTVLDFSIVNIPGSYASNRFDIVFNQLSTLPVTIKSIKAYQQASHINVDWKVDNESNVKQYEVEKSTDGTQFTKIATTAPTANGGGSVSYTIADANPVTGYNYYRVKSIDLNGAITYTTIVNVLIGDNTPSIAVYPNPVTNATINLQLKNIPAGTYGIRLINKAGQVIVSKKIEHAEGSSNEQIHLDKYTAHGIYQLEITSPASDPKNIEVIY